MVRSSRRRMYGCAATLPHTKGANRESETEESRTSHPEHAISRTEAERKSARLGDTACLRQVECMRSSQQAYIHRGIDQALPILKFSLVAFLVTCVLAAK